jgi:glutathione S-transferase
LKSKNFFRAQVIYEMNSILFCIAAYRLILFARAFICALAIRAHCPFIVVGTYRLAAPSTATEENAGMYTLYSMRRSGNCYKVRLAFEQLGVRYNLIEIDILRGETRTPDFLSKNPSGHVPLLEVTPGRYLPESNAILAYIATGTPLAPDDRIDRYDALQWMFFEQNSLQPNLGAAWFWLTLVKGGRELQMHALEDWMEKGYQALGVMEKHLATHRFFAAEESFFLPSAVRPALDFSAFTGGFFAAFGAFTSTVCIARATDAFAESSNSRTLGLIAANWSTTFESNVSTLVNRFRAFFAFITAP